MRQAIKTFLNYRFMHYSRAFAEKYCFDFKKTVEIKKALKTQGLAEIKLIFFLDLK